MIQDIAPHQYDNGYNPVPPDRDSIALYYEEHTALIKNTAEGIEFPGFADLERLNEEIYEEYTYLFSIDEERYYLVEEINRERLSAFTMENTEIFRRADPQYRAFAGITGYQLYSWYKNHRYCGHCGSSMKKDKKERMLYCEECHNMEYPKICPATIIGVTDGNRLLMSKYAGRAYKKYALLAGFVEIGETVEETVKREVMEEVGLKVKNVRYYKSQPWSFSDTVLMGFYCDLDGDDSITLDEEELALAEWFEREEIPAGPQRDSLTNEMIMKFKNGEI
ncbi:NAD(+) diphosphatase [Muricomes sp. OA1]|uniref:NAD(+) diphosphatase n=1 Tax=Hungatella hathewayi TaxID=154046 RepID=A0A3E2WXI2_9FIRM|nr:MULTISPECIES: NAD(+) diphosphatase [Clostridia]MCH1972909.1 NAD(+) diphosphatase [Muricomes sp. OA1]RGC32749.1 NAD(+) diphosphatase [Hungatella hathewayi]GKH31680.1 NADH pyrophosphatase [Faecalicatena contorta]